MLRVMSGEMYFQIVLDDYSGSLFVSTMALRDDAGIAAEKMCFISNS